MAHHVFSRTPSKTFATRDFAIRYAKKTIGDAHIRYVIAASADGRFFPIALGADAIEAELHFKMCCA